MTSVIRRWMTGIFQRSFFQLVLVLLYCHPDLERKITMFDAWKIRNASQDPIELVKLIQSLVYKHSE
jgi:hypothetical protein